MDQHPIRGKSRVQRGQGPCHRRLAVLFQRAIKITRPMQIGVRLGQPFDGDALKRQIVRRIGIEHTVDEHQLQPVNLVKQGHVFRRAHRGRDRLRLGQRIGAGVFPIFVTTLGQTCLLQTGQRVFARRIGPAPLGQIQRGDQRLGRGLLCRCFGHYATSDRMSAYPLFSTSSASSGPPVLMIRPSAIMCTTSGLMWSSRRW